MIGVRKILVVAVALLLSSASYAQSVAFLNIPNDAKSMAMGGASVAMGATAFAVGNNAAAMSLGENKSRIGVNYLQWQPDGTSNGLISGAAYYKFDRLAVGIGANSFSYQEEYDIYSGNGASFSSFKPSEISVNVGVSYRVISNLSIGVNAKYISSKLASSEFVDDYKNGSSAAFDISVMYKLGRLNVAAMATNLGSKISYGTSSSFGSYDLPAAVKCGASYSMGVGSNSLLTGTLEAGYLLYASGIAAGLGAEYAFKDMIFVRAGYHVGDENVTIPSYASFGVGAKLFGFTLDAAYLLAGSGSPLKNTLSIGLGVGF